MVIMVSSKLKCTMQEKNKKGHSLIKFTNIGYKSVIQKKVKVLHLLQSALKSTLWRKKPSCKDLASSFEMSRFSQRIAWRPSSIFFWISYVTFKEFSDTPNPFWAWSSTPTWENILGQKSRRHPFRPPFRKSVVPFIPKYHDTKNAPQHPQCQGIIESSPNFVQIPISLKSKIINSFV